LSSRALTVKPGKLPPIDFAAFAEACGAKGWTLEDPGDAERVIREALSHDGLALVEAVVDASEPPMPGKLATEQALHFAEALVRGQPDRWEILKTVVKDTIREVV